MRKFFLDMSSAVKDIARTDDEIYLQKLGYVVGSTIGEGSYAKVKSAFNETMGIRVAMKIINRKKAPKDFREKFLPRELEVLKHVRHENVIKMYEILEFESKIYIVMEHASHGDLLEYIKLRGVIPEDKARVMFGQLRSAVAYLHDMGIAHRDLKCENLLLDSNNNIKVSDFGFARYFEQRPSATEQLSKTFCGSAAYAAPEILQGICYHPPYHDIWAMGVILYIMVYASMPYDDSNIKKMIKDQLNGKLSFSKSKSVSAEARDLIRHILEVNVKLRYTLQDMLSHPWMQAQSDPNKPGPSGNDKTCQEQQQQQQQHAAVGDVAQHAKVVPKEAEKNDDTVVATV